MSRHATIDHGLFGASTSLQTADGRVTYFRLQALADRGLMNIARLPMTIKILLESLLRNRGNGVVSEQDILHVAGWTPHAHARRSQEFPFYPARVVMQDFTGVPAAVDLAAMRAAVARLGGDPRRVNPLVPVDLVIDHSVQVDFFGSQDAVSLNVEREYQRNQERYALLRWSQQAFENFRVVPPGHGIVHQINLEYLASVVHRRRADSSVVAYPDSLVGTDSHTTMINGLGVLGWGVGGIEAEAVLLGQPLYLLTPEVIGVRFRGQLPDGTTGTDLVLTVTQILRKRGVVGAFVEFTGAGLSQLSLADRATIANMCPEYGATAALFPVDAETGSMPSVQTQPDSVPITIAKGDGIGPEIMDSTLRILNAAGARLAIEEIVIGEKVHRNGSRTGIDPSAWESLRRTRVFLKAPITTPQGGGFTSLNVTVRKALGLYANVRPCVAYAPFVPTKHPRMDVVIVRENEEDLYAGIEHRQTDEVVQCLKLISRPGSERIVRYAFDYARKNNRKKVSCFTKDNIMKLADGLFHKVFDEIAADYPDIANEHWIVDIGMARLADTPEAFDVVVTPNLYGDVLSDVAAQIAGSVGMAGSANIGEHVAMFEAIHGSAPGLAGQHVANPSGLMLGAVMMLVHIGQPAVAERIHNAWLRTLEDGIATSDIFQLGVSTQQVATKAFARAVIERLGEGPRILPAVAYAAAVEGHSMAVDLAPRTPAEKMLVGVDVFLDWRGEPDVLGPLVKACSGGGLELTMIANRGVKVWPGGWPETFCTDHWRCRFLANDAVSAAQIIALLGRVSEAGLEFIKTEHLYTFDGQPGFSLGQGE